MERSRINVPCSKWSEACKKVRAKLKNNKDEDLSKKFEQLKKDFCDVYAQDEVVDSKMSKIIDEINKLAE